MQYLSPNSCAAGRKISQLIRQYDCTQAAELSASKFLICSEIANDTIGSHKWYASYPLRKRRLATRKSYLQQRNYRPDSRFKNHFTYPSVHRLLQEQGLKLDTANIPATGPNGCLLKGDVLAYLGRVKQDYLYEQSQRLSNLSHLDLSRRKSASVGAVPQSGESQAKKTNVSSNTGNFENADIEVTTSISFDAVHHCQQLLRRSLNVSIPSSKFISQASKIANERKSMQVSSHSKKDTVFDTIVVHGKTRREPYFVPSISSPPMATGTELKECELDYLNFLVAKWPAAGAPNRSERKVVKLTTREAKILSVKVKKDDRSLASIYLKKLKALLESEPGQLII